MVWERIGPEDIPFLLTAVVFLGLATWLMALGPDSRLNQAFSLFLVIRGVLNGLLAFITADPTEWPLRVVAYFEIAIPFVTLYFLYVCLHHYGRVRRNLLVPLLLLGMAVFFEAMYLLDPGLMYATGTPGPLAVFSGIKYLTYAFAALVLGVVYLRTAAESRRHALYLLALGFALDPLWLAFLAVAVLAAPVGLYLPEPLTGYAWATEMASALSLVPLTVLGLLLTRRIRAPAGDAWRREAARFLRILVLPAAAAAFVLVVYPLNLGLGARFVIAFHGIWPLVLGVLAIAAITRHQLVGADLRLKWTLSRGTLVAVFVFLFFILSEGAQVVIESRTGSSMVGVLGAGLLVLTLVPLQRMADRLADAAMPGVKPIEQMGHRERAELFQEWVRLAWSDGTMNKKERRMLDLARERLGLSPEEAARYEQQAVAA